jgi:diaminohydroxyphosphoribosylaminopyrimidine deaminase/5-amino-6-(5-phosphoribosylamino)uracil reductase
VPGDELYMARALALAERGRGRTSPNPMVGAVVVDRDGVVVGRGAHEYAGGPHAEVHALAEAAGRARGATLYCTLEPCCHTGRTGPCAPLVADAGISRAVIAVTDPNPLVAGKGLDHLRTRGVEVTLGVMREEAERLNRAFFSVMRRRRPFVTMKAALSIDGYLAAVPGQPLRLTSPASDRLVHRERAEVDAIAIGSGTLLADDPLLTARGAYRSRPLTRVVFDRRLRTPVSAKLLSTLGAGPVIIMSTPSTLAAAPDRVRALVHAGADVESADGLVPAFERLAARGISSVVVEGGATLHEAVWREALVDRVEMFVTPAALGPGGLEWLSFPIVTADNVANVTATPAGDDVLIEAYVHWPD